MRSYHVAKKYRIILSSIILLLTKCSLLPISEDVVSNRDLNEPSEGLVEDAPKEVEEDPRNIVSFYAVGDNLIHDQIIDYAEKEDGSFDFKPIYRKDRKSTRLNSSHVSISYAVFCLKKKKK